MWDSEMACIQESMGSSEQWGSWEWLNPKEAKSGLIPEKGRTEHMQGLGFSMAGGLSGSVVDPRLEVRGHGDLYKMATQRGEECLQAGMYDIEKSVLRMASDCH